MKVSELCIFRNSTVIIISNCIIDADKLLQAKKSNSLLLSRKPLGDKTDNEKSPLKTTEKAQKEIKIPTFADDDLWADVCSYKDIEGNLSL